MQVLAAAFQVIPIAQSTVAQDTLLGNTLHMHNVPLHHSMHVDPGVIFIHLHSLVCHTYLYTILAEPATIVLHNDVQSLTEAVANHSSSSSTMRLSLVCAAYGEPDHPCITWSSPTDGIEDYSILAQKDTSVNVINNYLPNTTITVSILELCDVRPDKLTVYMCDAANSIVLNLTSSQTPLGASRVMFSFINNTVQVVSSTEEVSFTHSLSLSHTHSSLSLNTLTEAHARTHTHVN